MILVTGSVRVRPEAIEDALALSVQHVERSRQEEGCLLHSVHRDVEDPMRLVFLEHWADRAALAAHFAVPESGDFVTTLGQLALAPASMEVYEAEPTRI